MPRIVLVHGAATTAAVWAPVLEQLGDLDATAPQRPYSGVLADELAWLRGHVDDDTIVVGAGGGATLCLALAASDARARAILAHEPAVGSLVPDLLAPVAAAFAHGGVAAMGRELYGPSWRVDDAPPAPEVARDLAMFRSFEPSPAHDRQGPVLVTTGEHSPAIRHLAATRLAEALGYATATFPGARHFVARESPAALAALVRATVDAA